MLVIGFNIGGLERLSKEKIIFGFVVIILFASIIQVWIQLRQWLLFDGSIWVVDMPPNGRHFANVAQPNQLCTLLIMGIMSVVYLFEKNNLNNLSANLITFFLLFGVALTQSRTSWIFAFCLLVWWFIKSKADTRLRLGALVIWILLFFGIWFCLPYLSEFLGITSIRSLAERASVGFERVSMWHQLIVILQNAPLQGYGWGQLNIAQFSNETKFIENPIFGYSHNLFLDLMIWNGVFLGLVISCLIVFFLFKLAFNARSDELIVILAMIGAILVHAMFEYPFAYAYFLLPIAFLLGFVYAQQNYISRVFYLNRELYILYIVGCMILISLFMYDYKK